MLCGIQSQPFVAAVMGEFPLHIGLLVFFFEAWCILHASGILLRWLVNRWELVFLSCLKTLHFG